MHGQHLRKQDLEGHFSSETAANAAEAIRFPRVIEAARQIWYFLEELGWAVWLLWHFEPARAAFVQDILTLGVWAVELSLLGAARLQQAWTLWGSF